VALSRGEQRRFAALWADAWNRRDVEAVLEHFHEHVAFTSPTALAVVGSPVVHGKSALRAYWNAALERVTALHFTVDRIVWDDVTNELAIVYIETINGKSKRVSENLRFDDSGLVIFAEVFHGIAV